jgi:cellulose synthase operon protein YhjQ
MNMADDIAGLLGKFGASPDGYLEVEATLDYTEPVVATVTAPVALAAVPAPAISAAETAVVAMTAVAAAQIVAPAKSKTAPGHLSVAAAKLRAIFTRAEPVVSKPSIVAPAANTEHEVEVESVSSFVLTPVSAAVAAPVQVAAPVAISAAKNPVAVAAVIPAATLTPVATPVTGIRSSLRSLLTEVAMERQAEALAANEETSPSANKPRTPAQVIAVVSPKGGVGKSTISAALAAALNRNGRAIAIDLDPQNALQYHVGVNPDLVAAVNAGLTGEDWNAGLLEGVAGTRVLPYGATSEKERRTFERDLEEGNHWLSGKLARMNLDASDVVVIDTPPGRTLYLDQAVDVADHVVVVITPDAGSFMVLDQIENLLEGRADHCSYIVNQFDTSRTFCQDMLKVLKRRLGTKLIGVVPLDHAISEGLAFGTLPLLEDQTSAARQEVLAIVEAMKLNVPTPVLAGGRA